MIKRFGRRALGPLFGRVRLQRLFESLYELSLAGMNFGEGTDPRLSGERFVMNAVAGIHPPEAGPLVVFDVGANVGVYTRELLDAFGDTAKIWAFEPSPSSFRLLEAEFSSTRNVRVRNVGFSDSEGTAILHTPGEGSKVASLYDTSTLLAPFDLSVTLEESVALTTLDQFCATESIERINFLKLDVEGHELHVLVGASTLLDERRIDAIQFEVSRANLESRTFLRDFFCLLNGRYHLYRVLRNGLYGIEQYKETYEVFKRSTNYLALSDNVGKTEPG